MNQTELNWTEFELNRGIELNRLNKLNLWTESIKWIELNCEIKLIELTDWMNWCEIEFDFEFKFKFKFDLIWF